MHKLITSLLLTLGLLLGGSAAPAAAADCEWRICAPTPPTCEGSPTGRPECPPPTVSVAEYNAVVDQMHTAEQTANDYRSQVATLTRTLTVVVAERDAHLERLQRVQRVADRRAATIARLRAKIRALR